MKNAVLSAEDTVKLKVNYFIDVAMLLALVACGISGIVKIPEMNIQLSPAAFDSLSLVHDWAGVASFALALAHVVLHARYFVSAPKALFWSPRAAGAKAPVSSAARRASGIVALVAVLLVAAPSSVAWARGRHISNPTIPQGLSYPAGSLKDGVYTGTATGYMPELSVEVTVKDGSIAAVRITDNNETPRWLAMVKSIIPQRIVSAQSSKVDIVSGATSSSYGIMSAVEDALKDAAKK
jgi:uncharacterized protein with FMN-binding domain